MVGVAKEKNDPVLLEQTVKKYQEAVSETRQAVEKSGKKDEFQKKLKKQEQQFKDVAEQKPILKDVLEEAIEVSKKVREGEVKGIEHQEAPQKIKTDDKKSDKIK